MKLTYSIPHLGDWLKGITQKAGISATLLAPIWGLKRRTAASSLERQEVEIQKVRALSVAIGRDLFLDLLAEETKLRHLGMAQELEAAQMRVKELERQLER